MEVGTVINTAGLVTKLTTAASAFAQVLGTLLVIWIAFRLFMVAKRKAGEAFDDYRHRQWDDQDADDRDRRSEAAYRVKRGL